MIGIDTNLLVRLLTNDDKIQAKFVANLLEENVIFIAKSVLLETEWVLRYSYELTPSVICSAFEGILGMPQIRVEDPACIIKTMNWYKHGFDFANAMHLASNHGSEEFATFDKEFIKQAKKLNIHLMTK